MFRVKGHQICNLLSNGWGKTCITEKEREGRKEEKKDIKPNTVK